MRNLFFSALLVPSIIFAAPLNNPIAIVVKIRGTATQLPPGAHTSRVVVLGDKFLEDTSVLTGPGSFIKIKFIDESEINLGPESKIVISEMKKDSVGIISLLKGRIRTEVSKNSDKPNDNKFFIKTRTAAMGVRGTEFQTIYNPDNKMTSLLTYRGEVAMAKIDDKTYEKLEESSTNIVVRDDVSKTPELIKDETVKKLDETEELNKVLKSKNTVLVPPGQNSFSAEGLKKSSVPVNISSAQLEALYKNKDFSEKSASNLNLHEGANENVKSSLKVVKQRAPEEGYYNEKTGEFAPKSGGYIDSATGLYIAPDENHKVGNIDADTGQYVAPKGLTLDANKGFIITGDEKNPDLVALKQDLNRSISSDLVMGDTKTLESFNIAEKFIRNRLNFTLFSMGQNLEYNKDSSEMPFFAVKSSSSVKLGIDWQIPSTYRFAPLIGLEYSNVNLNDYASIGISQGSRQILGLSYGALYAFNENINFYSKFGLHQEHFLNQTTADTSNTYVYQKVVVSRLTFGANAEFWRNEIWSVDVDGALMFSFRKRINNFVVEEGNGFYLEALPKYKMSEKSWLGLGVRTESHSQKVFGTAATNNQVRKTNGLLFRYISAF